MADWRQIQARIRKAKASADAPAQLSELYERTRDAMVAFELAQWQEKAADNSEAVRWYTVAAERFRRSQWRTKAEESLTRLGAPIPVPAPVIAHEPIHEEPSASEDVAPASSVDASQEPLGEMTEPAREFSEAAPSAAASSGLPIGEQTGKKPRRRGRRGGRNRRGKRGGATATAQASSPHQAVPAESPIEPVASASPIRSPLHTMPVRPAPESELPPTPARRYEPAVAPSWQGRTTRAGEPALASRIAQLESQVRRLLACPLASLEDADQAPAGPGVLLLSDSDQVTNYYVEACQTLRIGIGNLLRGGRGSKDSGALKERMAENLGIGESRVSKYLKDHCAVRWLQLDEGAPDLAHFAIAVLRPVVNE